MALKSNPLSPGSPGSSSSKRSSSRLTKSFSLQGHPSLPSLSKIGILQSLKSQIEIHCVRVSNSAQKKVYQLPGLNDSDRHKYSEIIRRFEVPEIKVNIFPLHQYSLLIRKISADSKEKGEAVGDSEPKFNMDEVQESGQNPTSRNGSASSSRSEALQDLLRKPIKGDIKEYIDFGSLRKKPKKYRAEKSQISVEDAKFPNLASWLLKKVEKCHTKRSQLKSIIQFDSESMSIFNVNS